jgi:hypothetical protein
MRGREFTQAEFEATFPDPAQRERIDSAVEAATGIRPGPATAKPRDFRAERRERYAKVRVAFDLERAAFDKAMLDLYGIDLSPRR